MDSGIRADFDLKSQHATRDHRCVAATPEGTSLLGVRTRSLQVCSIGAKVKSPLSLEPMTMRPCT
jgi:hypothetical protein